MKASQAKNHQSKRKKKEKDRNINCSSWFWIYISQTCSEIKVFQSLQHVFMMKKSAIVLHLGEADYAQ